MNEKGRLIGIMRGLDVHLVGPDYEVKGEDDKTFKLKYVPFHLLMDNC